MISNDNTSVVEAKLALAFVPSCLQELSRVGRMGPDKFAGSRFNSFCYALGFVCH